MKSLKRTALILVLISGLLEALPIPKLEGRVNDLAKLLLAEQAAELESFLAEVEQDSSAQFVLLTIPTLENEVLENYSLAVAESWKLGHRDRDNGLLMLIALQERAVRIEVGYGLEGILPDGRLGTIIRSVIVPAFRAEDYYGGIKDAFALMAEAVGGEPGRLQELVNREQESPGTLGGLISFFIFLGFWMFMMKLAGKLGGKGGSGFSTGGRSSSGWSSGGFSGGGGSFGGGGASGRW